MSAETLPTRIGPYEVRGALARGGFGQVHLARDLRDGREVVLKWPASSAAQEADALLREYDLLARIDHPGYTRVFDLLYDRQARWAFAMEWLQGSTLEAQPPRPGADALGEVALRLLDALDVLHERGLVHADLSPANVFLTRDVDGASRLVLLDLAMASAPAEIMLTPRGTPLYLAPEILSNRRPDPRSDLYSVGAMLYEWAAGQPPVSAPTAAQLFELKVQGHVEPLSRLRPDLPPRLTSFIHTLLSVDPQARPEDASHAYSLLAEGMALSGTELPPRKPRLPQPLIAGVEQGVLPLLGRVALVAGLWSQLQSVVDDRRGRVAWVHGEVGAGKSTLARHLTLQLSRRGRRPLVVSCQPSEPFGVIRSLLRAARLETGVEEPSGRVWSAREAWLVGLSDQTPSEGWGRLDLAEDASSLVAELIAGEGRVVLIDDVDLADAASLFVLRHIALRVEQLQIFWLLLSTEASPSGRSPLGGVLHALKGEEVLTLEERLEPFTLADIDAVLTQRFGELQGRELLRVSLWEVTNGNPGDVEAGLNLLVEKEALVRQGRRWVLVEALMRQVIQTGLRRSETLSARRLERVEPGARLVLAALVVRGRVMSAQELAELLGHSAARVQEELAQLAGVGLARRAGAGWIAAGGLARSVPGLLEPLALRRLHKVMGRWLEGRFERGGEDAPTAREVAGHLLAAGELDGASWVRRAVPGLMATGAWDEVKELCRHALAVEARSLMSDPQLKEWLAESHWHRGESDEAIAQLESLIEEVGPRSAGQPALKAPLARYLRKLASMYIAGSRRTLALAPAERALALMEEIGAERHEKAEVLSELGRIHQVQGDLARASQVLKDALLELGALGAAEPVQLLPPERPEWLARSIRVAQLLCTTLWLMRSPTVEELLVRAVELAGSVELPMGGAPVLEPAVGEAVANLRMMLGVVRWTQGDLQGAEVQFEAARLFFDGRGQYQAATRADNSLAVLRLHTGRWRECRELWERFRRLSLDVRDDGDLVTALNNLGALYLDMGMLDLGRRRLEQAVERGKRAGFGRMMPMLLGNLGDAFFRGGQVDQARRHYRRALNKARRLGARGDEVETVRRIAELEFSQGSARAMRTAEQALELARQVGSRWDEGIVLGLLGLALVRHGSAEGGMEMLARGEQILAELGQRLDLARLRLRAAEAWALQQRIPESEARLQEAERTFADLGAQWDLLRTRRLRERLELAGGGEERSRRSLDILLDVGRSLSGELNLERLLTLIISKTMEVARADRGFVILFDDQGRPSFRAAQRMGLEEVEGGGAVVSSTVVEKVLSTQRPVVITDVSQALDLKDRVSVVVHGLRSILALPMIRNRRVLGIIYVDSVGVTQGFFRRDMHLLESLAETAAMYVENAQLYDSLRRKTELMYILAHELRSPLSASIAYSQLLLADCDNFTTDQREYVDIIQSQGHRLARMITSVLDLARLEAGRIEWSLSRLRLTEVLDSTLKGLRPLAREKEIHVQVDASEGGSLVFGNPDRLIQVFTNLLSNAYKFVNHGGRVWVRIFESAVPPFREARGLVAQREGWIHRTLLGGRRLSASRCVMVRIDDDGPGLPTTEVERLFVKFSQIGSAGMKEQGTGLGLAICREIVEHHGGHIWAENRPQGGASFCFYLPQAEGEA